MHTQTRNLYGYSYTWFISLSLALSIVFSNFFGNSDNSFNSYFPKFSLIILHK